MVVEYLLLFSDTYSAQVVAVVEHLRGEGGGVPWTGMHPPITHRRCRITRTLDPRKIAKQCVINITWVRSIREIRVRDLLIRVWDGLRRRITRRRNAAMLGEWRLRWFALLCVIWNRLENDNTHSGGDREWWSRVVRRRLISDRSDPLGLPHCLLMAFPSKSRNSALLSTSDSNQNTHSYGRWVFSSSGKLESDWYRRIQSGYLQAVIFYNCYCLEEIDSRDKRRTRNTVKWTGNIRVLRGQDIWYEPGINL